MIIEQEKKLPVAGEYDVIVAGGGIAGVAAALAAARNGAKTLLMERMFLLGGLATAGLVTIYLPLCDGKGTQVSYGIAEELLRLSVKHGIEPVGEENARNPWLDGGSLEERTKERYEVRFNAQVFAILCEQLLREEGVDLLYGTSVCGGAAENGKLRAVIVENKSGRQAYTARAFVDATGDADLCKAAGEGTVCYTQGNILSAWYYEYGKNGIQLHLFNPAPESYAASGYLRFSGLDGKELSDYACLSHEATLNHFLKNGGIGPGHALTTLATTPQVRMTRRVDGVYTLDAKEDFTTFEDSIGMISDWHCRGPVYEMPFRCLYGHKIKNLITAGRCISATEDMWEICRVIPHCAITGQAAGTAAAMTDDFNTLDMKALQSRLKADGVRLHLDEIGLKTK